MREIDNKIAMRREIVTRLNRLERALSPIWQLAINGDYAAANKVLDILAQRRRLIGELEALDAEAEESGDQPVTVH